MVKSVIFALLLVATAVSAQYGHSSYGHSQPSYGHSQPSYGHSQPSYGGHAESFQNFHLEVGHQVPVQVPVYHHQPSYHQQPSYQSSSHY